MYLIDISSEPNSIKPDKKVFGYGHTMEYGGMVGHDLVDDIGLYQISGDDRKLINKKSYIRPGKDGNAYAEGNKGKFYQIGKYQTKGYLITELNMNTNKYSINFNFLVKNIKPLDDLKFSQMSVNVTIPQNAVAVSKSENDFLAPSNSN
jgi:hypothetical protein